MSQEQVDRENERIIDADGFFQTGDDLRVGENINLSPYTFNHRRGVLTFKLRVVLPGGPALYVYTYDATEPRP